MLRYDRQTKPGLVALYDIRPGNGVGPFLQPRSPHGALESRSICLKFYFLGSKSSFKIFYFLESRSDKIYSSK